MLFVRFFSLHLYPIFYVDKNFTFCCGKFNLIIIMDRPFNKIAVLINCYHKKMCMKFFTKSVRCISENCIPASPFVLDAKKRRSANARKLTISTIQVQMRHVLFFLVLFAASIFAPASTFASYKYSLSGGGNSPGTVYPGTNVVIYSFLVTNTGSNTNGLENITFSTTGTATSTDISSYTVYLSNTNALTPAAIFEGNVSFTSASATYTVAGANYVPTFASGAAYYMLIVANFASTATVGNSIAVSAQAANLVWINPPTATSSSCSPGNSATIGSFGCTSSYYAFTGAMSTYNVPVGCTQLAITAAGAQGGGNDNYNTYFAGGGLGGQVTATVTVTAGATLDVFVGGQGGTNLPGSVAAAAGGWNGGGTGGYYNNGTSGLDGGGGGGATDVSTSSTLNASTILVAAGGGGGAGFRGQTINYNRGGAGGGLTGENGYDNNGAIANTGGTQTSGGTAGYAPGAANTGGTGNAGGRGDGGGGGGFYGGSAGSATGVNFYGSGGGGGSSFVAGAASLTATHTQGVNPGNGYVIITPVPPTVYTVSGSGTGCTVPGMTITLSGSQSGVNYQLYNGASASGTPLTGTGSAITWTTTVTGTYTVSAYYTGYSSCAVGMSGNAVISVNPTPSITGGSSSICVFTTTTITATPASGAWLSTNTGIATIGSSSGVVAAGGSTGTTTISYTVAGCTITQTETITSNTPGPITGPGIAFCGGATTSLSDGTTGGAWSSLNTAVATVTGSGTSATITGVAPGGTATIQYSTGCGAPVTYVVTVNTTPTGILGTTGICASGGTTTLSDAVGVVTWSSSLTGIATITSGGLVTGAAAGTTIISCFVGSCYATTIVTVSLGPAPILGSDVVTVGGTVTLSDITPGGTWSSSSAHATVGTNGVVTGVSAGTANIIYTTSCGTSVLTVTVYALTCSTGLYTGSGCIYVLEVSSFSITGACGSFLNDIGIPCTGTYYNDHTSLPPVAMYPNTTYSGTIADGGINSPDYAYVWIDFNNDGIFAASELVWSAANICCAPTTTSIAIPAIGYRV